MKKIIFVALAAIVSTGAFAQNFEWGVKAGLNVSSVSKMKDILSIDEAGAAKFENKMRTGFVGGFFGEYVINDYFGIQAELLYSMQGSKYTFDAVDGAGTLSVKSTVKTDYINLPILAKFYILEGFSVEIGPQFGYMISAKQKFSGIEDDVLEDAIIIELGGENLYDHDDLKKFDISAALGLSYKFNFGLDVFARYNLGLTEVYKDTKSKNGVLSLGVGYRF